MKEEIVYTKQGTSNSYSFKVGEKYNIDDFINMENNIEAFNDFKRRIFDCKEVKYNKTTGRVNYMLFVERKMTQDEYEYGL